MGAAAILTTSQRLKSEPRVVKLLVEEEIRSHEKSNDDFNIEQAM
jgi:hypothetical protein